VSEDNNIGLNRLGAWKTIDKVNATLLLPGNQVRFGANPIIYRKLG
jgi:hypothetical protein